MCIRDRIDGETVDIRNPKQAISHGIGMVHQHFMLVENMTIAENIVLGSEPTKSLGRLDHALMNDMIRDFGKQYGLEVDPEEVIMDVSVATQQRVEILKALFRGVDILILDEPTAVLTPQEIDSLIVTMRSLVADGKTIIIITHKLKEIMAAADDCTVIRLSLIHIYMNNYWRTKPARFNTSSRNSYAAIRQDLKVNSCESSWMNWRRNLRLN